MAREDEAEGLVPALKEIWQEFLQRAKRKGYYLRIVHGKTKHGKCACKTYPRSGESLHLCGRAIDVADHKRGYKLTNEQWLEIAQIGESLGLYWGGYTHGRLVDRPHFEYHEPPLK